MEIRQLQSEEWALVEPIFKAEGGVVPNMHTSNIMGAFDKGQLVGFWCVQVMYHAGPLWIAPEHRGTRLWEKIHNKLAELLDDHGVSGFYSFSGCAKVESIFKQLNYTDLGYKLWKKEIK